MLYPCNIGISLESKTAALFGLGFVTATSYYIARSAMARNRKRGDPRLLRPTGSPATAPRIVDTQQDTEGKGAARASPAATAAPSTWEIGSRPETSPYGSPLCTIPFATPLTVPLDILRKSPKLHAAYENRLPELATVPEDVCHVLVHFLYTGVYESLEPKSTDSTSRQINELRTSIQAYAAARDYDLPSLMLQAEARIDKHGVGLSLPTLLEVARDAHPLLTQEDHWFLDYLRARIRPHLDAESLLGSDVLDQIGGILSPHKLLLKTVLELFCERLMSDRAGPVVVPAIEPMSSATAGSATRYSVSAGLEEPPSLPPGVGPAPVTHKEFALCRPGTTEASRSTSQDTSEHPSAVGRPPDPASLHMRTTPVFSPGIPAVTGLGPVVVDFTSLSEPLTETGATTGSITQPATSPVAMDVIGVEDGAVFEGEPETTPVVKMQTEAITATAAQDAGEELCRDPVSVIARCEEEDSCLSNDSKSEDGEPNPNIPCVPEPATEPTSQVHAHRWVLRDADSGFWETPEIELQRPLSQHADMKSAVLPLHVSEPISELEPSLVLTTLGGVNTHNEGDSARTDRGNAMHQKADMDATLLIEESPALHTVQDRVLGAEHPAVSAASAAGLMSDQGSRSNRSAPDASEAGPSLAQSRDAEAASMTEKTEPGGAPSLARSTNSHAGAEIPSSDRLHSADNVNQPAGSVEPTPAPPDFEVKQESAGEDGVQGASDDTSRAGHLPALAANEAESLASSNGSLKPMPDLGRAKTNAESPSGQPCNDLARQRSWKKRFLNMRYPVLFGRGM